MGACIGMDFGTSNSTVGIVADGAARLVPLEGGHGPIPSAIFFDLESGRDHFGREAIELYTDGTPGRLMRSLKSVLGTSLMSEATRIRARLVPFEDILGRFIRHLKATAEAQLDREISHVVMGRPVHFVDDDEAADRLAQDTLEAIARKQGFKTIRFQYEPIAAALDYEQSLAGESLAMIADFGGGTADFTVARLRPGASGDAGRVLANGGVHIGGTDMDRVLSGSQVMPHFGHGSPSKDGKRNLPVWPFNDLATWHRINRLSESKALAQLRSILQDAGRPDRFERLISVVEHRDGHRLAGQVEAAKVGLSAKDRLFSAMAGLDGAEIEFLRMAFEHAISPLVAQLRETSMQTLASAGVTAGQIDAVFLTGGTTQIPAVRQMLEQQFPASRFVTGDVFGSVGLGLALEAERAFG